MLGPIAALWAASIVTAAADVTLNKPEVHYLRARRELVFASETYYPPFEFAGPNGERTGITTELVRWMAAEFGYQASFVHGTLAEARQAVRRGRADALTGLFYSRERDKHFDFTQVLFRVPAWIYVHADRLDIRAPADLEGKVVAAPDGDYAIEFLKEQGIGANVLITADFAEAIGLVASGEADAVIGDQQPVHYHVHAEGVERTVKRVGEPVYEGLLAMAVPEGEKVLLGVLNKGIRRARESGVLKRIEDKWLGRPLSRAEPWPVRYLPHIVVAAVALSALVLLVWLWNVRLRVQVNRRTAELHASERRFRTIYDALNDGLVIIDPATHAILDANARAVEMFGWNLEELRGMRLGALSSDEEEYSDAALRGWVDSVTAGEAQLFEWRVRNRQGRPFWCEANMRLADIDGRRRVLIAARDVTARKTVEADYERLATAIEQAAETIVITDLEGTIQYVNPAFEEITGYARREALGENPRLLKSGEHDETLYAEMWGTLLKGETWEGRMVNRRKDGSLYTEEATISPVRDERGRVTHYVAVKRDISQEITLERQLLQAQKLEAVGKLAGGIAHDFNNLLMVIMNSSQFVKESLPEHAEGARDIDDVIDAARKAADLTRQLLAFSRRQPIRPRRMDLNEVLKDEQKMLRRLIRENIRIELRLDEQPCMSELDPGQISQVLVNLVVNARDAMPEGGVITLESRHVRLDGEDVEGIPDAVERPTGRFVMFSVGDTGVGMKPEEQARIFEPFYSTKRTGDGGTGLGLATVYGIVKQHGGFVGVYSEEHKGTVFKIYLPESGAKEEGEVADTERQVLPRGCETVLLVEDEPAVLRVGTRMLRELGYEVLAASGGDEALALLKERAGAIDLLITDLVMPGMHGSELADRVRELRPETAVLYASGYPETQVEELGLGRPHTGLINKPFVYAEIARRVREVLEGVDAGANATSSSPDEEVENGSGE